MLVGSEYRVQTVNDATGTTTFAYNTSSRRTDVTNGLNQQWSYYYDAGGQLIQVQTPAVSGQRLSTYFLYDVDGNVTRITDGLGNVVLYQYDANGNRTLERDSAGTTVKRTFDAANQLLNEIRYSLPATWNSTSATWTDPPASSAQVTRYLYDGITVRATGSVPMATSPATSTVCGDYWCRRPAMVMRPTTSAHLPRPRC